MKSSWFSRIAAASAIACVLALPAAPAAAATAADSTKAAAKAAAPSAADSKEAKRAARDQARKNADAEKAKKEAVAQAKRDMETKADLAAGVPWVGGANWAAYRIGTAHSAVKNSPQGGVAVGFGMHHFFNRRWSGGFQADLDVLGKFSGGTEMELPLTLQFTRHMKFNSNTMRPYLGVGGGAYFHRYYRTGADEANLRPGFFAATGINTPVAPHSLIGFDVRMTYQGSAQSDDPLFPNPDSHAIHWSFKFAYMRWNTN